MSGTDYTQTPNLALYKPIFNMAVGQWGDLWNSNADTLDSAIHNLGGGPFLPLSGGHVSGQTTFGGTTTLPAQPFLYAYQNVGGTAAAGQQANWYAFNINNDNADASGAAGAGAHGLYIGHNIAAGAKGGRTGVTAFLTQGGATTSASGTYYVALGAFTQTNYTAGGTSGSPLGAVFGFNCGGTVGAGSGFYNSVVGAEIDVCAQAGTSVAYKCGVSIVQYNNDAVRGSSDDSCIGIAMQGFAPQAPGWATGLQFGQRSGWWPFTGNSTMIGTMPGVGGGPPMIALNGIDLSAVSFGAAAFKSPGFTVNFAGHIQTSAGIDFGAQLSSGPQDFSKHINLYNGQFGICVDNAGNTAYTASAGHVFWMGTTSIGFINSTGLNIAIGQQSVNPGAFSVVAVGTTAGPTWTTGSAAPAATAPVGSLYSRTGGAVGATLYVSRGAGTWAPVAGV